MKILFPLILTVILSVSAFTAKAERLVLVGASYGKNIVAITDAKGDVLTDGDPTDPREIMLPSSSRNTFNAVVGYENGPLSLRLAGTYRDKYLDEVGAEAVEDRYVDDHFQLDLTAKFKVTRNIQIYADWININNANYFAYQNYNGRQRLLQYEEYGSTVKFGTRIKF